MICCFIKFFESEEWADQFLAGRLYLNTLGYFKGLESAATADRGDPTEAVSIWLQPHDVVMTLRIPPLNVETVITEKDLAKPVQVSTTYHEQLHLLCLYAVHTDNPVIGEDGKIRNFATMQEQLHIDPRCFDMGKFAVVVASPALFLERLFAKMRDLGLAATGRLVNYYDDASFSGEIASSDIEFSKQKRFSYQREWRLRVNSNTANPGPITLDVGALPQGSFKLHAREFENLNLMRFVPKEPTADC